MESSTTETLCGIASFAQIVIALVAVVMSTGVAIWVYRGNKRVAEVQYWRSVREAWMDIQKFALESETNLELADSLLHPELTTQSDLDRRSRWFGYMVLNTFVSHYLGPDNPQPSSKAQVKQDLKPLMQNDSIYYQTQTGIFGPEFKSICREIRKEQGLPTG